MVTSVLEAGNCVLLVGNPVAQAADMQTAQESLAAQVTPTGTVVFEQLDRIPHIVLGKAKYHAIESGSIAPAAFPHGPTVLAQMLSALLPNGTVHLREPVLVDSAAAATATATEALRLPVRTASALLSALKLAGYVDGQVTASVPMSDEDVARCVMTCWGVTSDEVPRVAEFLKEKVLVVDVVARKPAYEVGAASALPFSFARKKPAAVPASSVSPAAKSKVPTKQAVWTVSANDEDDEEHELEDEDDLLDEADLMIPNKSVPDDCEPVGGKRKACKDCTCGRAEMEDEEAADEEDAKIVVVTPRKKAATAPASSCGSCYLGDAFRCSSCPYLGMPAFKPGEKVVLAGNLLKDDVEF
ncbi:electron carrier [Thoreauomyces humboldtii]|nr:electron carrier [Thoreauomyces humboldtii]